MSKNVKVRQLLTPRKASEKYGIDRSKIYSWIRERKFNFIKPEKEVLFWEDDLLNFLESNSIPGEMNV